MPKGGGQTGRKRGKYKLVSRAKISKARHRGPGPPPPWVLVLAKSCTLRGPLCHCQYPFSLLNRYPHYDADQVRVAVGPHVPGRHEPAP